MNEGQLRDQLAAERTRLANERTLLAYVRTALALAAGGAALLQFFPAHGLLGIVAWGLVLAGGVTMVIGAFRFAIVRRQLRGH
jgi:putative membrane protein